MGEAPVSALLEVGDLHVQLGGSHILQGVSFEVPRGRGDRAARPQRRRQDDDAAGAPGPRAARRARSRSAAPTSRTLQTHEIVRRGVGYVPGGPRRLRRPHRRREPAARRARRREPRYDLVYELFPELNERGRAAGRHALGRAAADGRDRPRAAERQPDPARRRADQGARADGRRRGRRACSSASAGVDDGAARRAEPRASCGASPRDVVVLDTGPRRPHRPGDASCSPTGATRARHSRCSGVGSA